VKNCDSDFIILIDALRHDFIDQKRTPFLFELRSKGAHAEVIETLAFQTRPAYFAGLEPQQSNICNLFEYDPENSPFRFLRPWGLLTSTVDRAGLSGPFRKVIKRIARWNEARKGNDASANVLTTQKVPLNLLHFFSPSEKHFTDAPNALGNNETVFDAFRRAGKPWAWIGYPRHFGSTQSILSHYQDSPQCDIVYLHFSELDWVGHRYGPNSLQMEEAIAKMDRAVRGVLEEPLRRGRTAVIFGDHGMVEIKYVLDLKSTLDSLHLTIGRDYLYFLDSTQVRLWFFSDRSEEVVGKALSQINGGRILGEDERKQLGVDFIDNRYGDMLFVVDGPGLIHPSYFSRGKAPPKGMHGYIPSVRENATQVVAVGPDISPEYLGTIKMTQIYRIILDSLLK
jgi:predicted AlkP superfamily pyrophosphatase or phosphodiesterase